MAFGKWAMEFIRGTGCGYVIVVSHAKVTAVYLWTYYKLTRRRLKLSPLSGMQQNVLGGWEAS